MYDFLLSATDREGRRKTHHVRAETSQEAYRQLEERDYTEIVLHTDDAAATVLDFESLDTDYISPADFVALSCVSPLGFFLFLLRRLYIQMWMLVIPAIGLLAVKWWKSDDLGYFGLLAIIVLVAPWVIAFDATFFGTSRQYDLLLDAYAWGRWDELLRRAPALRGHVPDFDLSVREAVALAGLGRVDEGRAKFAAYENSAETPRWMYYNRLAEFYEAAKMHDRSLECHSLAFDDDPDNPSVQLDYAMALLKNERDAGKARQLIDAVKKQHLGELLACFLPMIEGLWLLNTGNFHAAADEFLRARSLLRSWAKSSPLVGMMIDFNQALLAIALAESGDAERAREVAKPAIPRVKALGDTRLLQRLERTVGV